MNKILCAVNPIFLGLAIVLVGNPAFAQNALLDSIQVMGGSGLDNVISITPDNAGNLFVLGATRSTDFPATATFGNVPVSSSINHGDTFVAKIRLADWSLTWSAVIRDVVPLALATDSSGAVYLTGWTDSPASLAAAAGGFRMAASGDPLFVLKLDATGSRIVYAALLAPYILYTSAPIAVDRQGQVYVASEGLGPITTGALFSTGTGAYLAKLSADGSKVIFGTHLATSETTAPQAIAVDEQQNIFIAGRDDEYLSTFPSTPGVIQSKHAGGDDAFVMKLRADGGKIEFATLLGGAGGDSANFLLLGSDGSIYVAGYCDYGSGGATDAPFPITPNAPFRTFGLFRGFVAKISADASSLLFSTYVPDTQSAGVTSFGIAGNQVYAAYPMTISRGFVELNYSPTADLASTAVQVFDANTGASAGAALQLPALAPGAVAVSGTILVIASNGSQISLPVPSTIHPIGPLDDPSTPTSSPSDITFGKFDLAGTADHDIDTDRGNLYFEVYPGAPPTQTLHITSSAGAVPYQLFAPGWAGSVVSPREGLTSAAVNVSPFSAADSSSPGALLLVSPRASPSIQILPVLVNTLAVQISVRADGIVLPADGGPATGTIRITAAAVSPVTLVSNPVSIPFQFGANSLPPDLTLDTLSGTTPATIHVTGQLDSLPPGTIAVEQLLFTAGDQLQEFNVALSRPGPTPLVNPGYLYLTGVLGQGFVTGSVQVNAPDNATAFHVLSIPTGISVSPPAGTGSAVLTVTADLTRFPVGTTSVTFSIQVGSAQEDVIVRVAVSRYQLSVVQGPEGVAPGVRLRLSAYGVAGNLPKTGAWAEVSPAPTDWNGYSFVYGAHPLPIGGKPAYIDQMIPNQINVQVPDIGFGMMPVVVTTPSGVSPAYAVNSQPYGPAFWPWPGKQAVATHADYTIAAKNGTFPGTTTVPAKAGEVITLWGTGFGPVAPFVPAGQLPGQYAGASTTSPVTVRLNGTNITVFGAALSGFPGDYQVAIQIPAATPSGDYTITATIGGVTSPTTFLTVQQ